ncbi:MAG: 4Fe-4S binding protein [Elusimicrobia bacterium]|nr:4Fe-4S binding protein [Elusimicrobiota bacterium]MBU2614894.1 4Fe-4S binding protein [Elusimicrobiota bacterium]
MNSDPNTIPSQPQQDRRKRSRIGDVFVLDKIVSKERMREVLQEQRNTKKKLGKILLEKGYVTKEELKDVVAKQNLANGYWQKIVQTLSFIFTNSYVKTVTEKSIYVGQGKGFCLPFLHCYACPASVASCPIGNLQHFSAIRSIPYYTLGFIGLVGMTTGRLACGWLCPFGFLQDLMFKIKSKKIRIPTFYKYFKYFFLVAFVFVLPYITGIKWFSQICPNGGLIAGIPWVLWNPISPVTGDPTIPAGSVNLFFWLKMAILLFFLVMFVMSKRPFCRIMCPMGAMLSLFNRVSLMNMEVSQTTCGTCNLCREVCPVDIKIYDDPKSMECIRCLHCTACPSVKFKLTSFKTPSLTPETKTVSSQQ